MERKSGFKLFLEYLEEHMLATVAILLVLGCVVWTVCKKVTAPKRSEQVNFAVTAFAHHSDGKGEELQKLVANAGIKEVNLSFFDISNPSGTAEYLLTYGAYQADILILDTSLGKAVLDDCFCVFSVEQSEELSKAVGFDLKFVRRGEDNIGVIIHENGNDAYNERFGFMNEWLLFGADGIEYDYAVFFNADSPHNETSNFEILKHILQ